MDMKKLITIFGILLLVFGGAISVESIVAVRSLGEEQIGTVSVIFAPLQKRSMQKEEMQIAPSEPVPSAVVPSVQSAATSSVALIPEKTLLDVPFAPQAPFGNWADERQYYGCEEASIIMAVYWAEGKELTYAKMEEEVIAVSEFEKKSIWEFL